MDGILMELFEKYASFYSKRYLPFLIEEGFIDDPDDSEFAEAIEGFERENVDSLPDSYRELLSKVGYGGFFFPTDEGPVRFAILGSQESASWKTTMTSFLAKAGDEAKAIENAIPFLVDESGSVFAFVAGQDQQVFVIDLDGNLRGPIESLYAFFSTVFDNAREHRMPFDGI